MRFIFFILLNAFIFAHQQSHANIACQSVFTNAKSTQVDLSQETNPGQVLIQNHFNPKSEILIAFDSLSHPYLIVNDIIFHGRLVTRPISIERKRASDVNGVFAIKIGNFTEAKIANFVEYLEGLRGKKSFTCVNALQAALAQGLGIEIGNGKTLIYIEEFIDALSLNSLTDNNQESHNLTAFKLTNSSIDEIKDRGELLKSQLKLAFPVLNKIAKQRLLNNENALLFKGSDNREFILNTSDEQINQKTENDKSISKWKIKRMWLAYASKRVWNFIHSTGHNVTQAWNVFSRLDENTKIIQSLPEVLQPVFKLLFRTFAKPMKFGLIKPNHPWITGLDPVTGQEIWPQNIIFSTKDTNEWNGKKNPDPDSVIVTKVGKFLAAMTRKSVVADVEQGPTRRMPHVVNYLHGAVGYNGAFLIFNNFREATDHLTDPNFIKEIKRFVKNENREIMIVFRDRDYDEQEYAYFLGVVRSVLPWYANANGPQKKVLWGSVSPYATINIINGSYFKHIEALEKEDHLQMVLPGINTKNYFTQNNYSGFKDSPGFTEKLFAWINYLNIQRRGFQSNIVFTPREQIEPNRANEYNEAMKNGKDYELIAPIKKPNF